MVKQKGLGRGLDALLSRNGSVDISDESLQNLEISKLQPGKYQPRTNMDQVALAELAESIKAQGVMQPILVRPISDDQYEIIAGERRWRAAKIAGLRDIPVYIRQANDQQLLELALLENLQRENLNAIEIGISYKRMMEELAYTQEQVAERMGKERSTVTNYIRL
mgnify:CR=1 FL=1